MEDLGADYAAAMKTPTLTNLPKQQSLEEQEISAFEDAQTLIQEKVANKRIEMIWFGGIGQELLKDVFHVTL